VTQDPILQNAADTMLDWVLHRAPRAADGTIYHAGEPSGRQLPHHAALSAYTGHYDEAIQQIDGHRKRLWTRRKNCSRISGTKRTSSSKKEFLGCVTAGPRGADPRDPRAAGGPHGGQRTAGAFLRELLDGCIAYQRADGLFHDMVDDPTTHVETNLANMLAFSIYESVRGGWLPAEYLKAPTGCARRAGPRWTAMASSRA